MTDSYQSDFEKFLSHTDEKQVLLEEISKEIERFSIDSILDIGAGNGLLSIPLSKKVERYLAIEQKPSFAEKLQKAGLSIVQGSFPLEIPGNFDLVLVSHALSYAEDLFRPFIKKAWELVNQDGILLIITYRAQDDDWTNLTKQLGESSIDYNNSGFNQIVDFLRSLGKVEIRSVITRVRTTALEDMVGALSFVFSDGQPHRKQKFFQYYSKLTEILNSQYRDDLGFSFPFQHFFVTTQKT